MFRDCGLRTKSWWTRSSHAARNRKRSSFLRSEFALPWHWGWSAGNQCGGNEGCVRSDCRTSWLDEKDIKVSLDSNQLVICGEKKAESTKEEKDWHVEERSYGSFYRSMSLPFEPEDGAVDAHFDEGAASHYQEAG